MKPSWLFSICFLSLILFTAVIGADDLGVKRKRNHGDDDDDDAWKSSFISWDDLKVESVSEKSHGHGHGRNEGKSDVIVVDKDGNGDSLTIQAAVDMVPRHNSRRVKIHILPGIYSEKVTIPKTKPYISFIGDTSNPEATVITWHDKASDNTMNREEIGTFGSASVAVESDYFCAAGITFQNSVQFRAGVRGNQAVALRVAGDRSVFYKSRFLGSQDTLLDEAGTHLFMECFIQGSVDFIFGNARSLYKECTLSVVGHPFAIAAQRRESASDDGAFSFVNCTVKGTGSIYLGRAWGDYSRIIYSYTEFDIKVKPQGWDDFGQSSRQKTVLFGEYECRGKGANRSGRVPWSKALTHDEARPYLDSTFINGKQWLRLY